MDVVAAIKERKSIRAFKPDPVPREILREIIDCALRAPSWTNTQPWKLAIVSGRELEAIRSGLREKVGAELTTDFAHPRVFPEPYDTRRRVAIARSHESANVRWDDKEQRKWWELQQLSNFGSPCEIYICLERSLYIGKAGTNIWPVFDCGLIAENIILLATHYGLGTILQARAAAYPDIVRRVLGIPDSQLILLGIAIGYSDEDNPVNQFRSDRESRDKVAKWYGFD